MRVALSVLLTAAFVTTHAAERRPITIDDQFRLNDVGSPQLSPDGEWLIYTVTSTDMAADRRNADLWKVKYDGTARHGRS